MPRTIPTVLSVALATLSLAAAAQVQTLKRLPTAKPVAAPAQQAPSAQQGIIVQGGLTPSGTSAQQGIIVQGGLTPGAGPSAQQGIVVQGGLTPGAEAIGPKQDDPLVQGMRPAEQIGPKQDDPLTVGPGGGCEGYTPGGEDDPQATPSGALAIGPKQDDPRSPQLASRPDDDNDPKARNGLLAIGPKQDDPRAPAAVAQRPGDDEDPQARCLPGAKR